MKFRTVLATAVGVGIGYVLGTRAGRGKFEEIKAQAQRIATDPDVRQKVADLPHQVRENLPKAQSAVSDAIKTASDKVQGKAAEVKSATADSAADTSPDSPLADVAPDGPVTETPLAGTAGVGHLADSDSLRDDVADSVVTEPVPAEPTVVVVEPTVTPDESKP